MKRLLGILLLVCLSTPTWALSPEGKALLDKMRAKFQPAPAVKTPIPPPQIEVEKDSPPVVTEPDFRGPAEGAPLLPVREVPIGNFADLNAVDPTIAHEENGRMVPGAPKKIKIAKGSKNKNKNKNKKKKTSVKGQGGTKTAKSGTNVAPSSKKAMNSKKKKTGKS